MPRTPVAANANPSIEQLREDIDLNSAEGKRQIAVRLIQKLSEAGFACELALSAKYVEK